VFEGGIALAAAEAVCGPPSELGVDVVEGLVSLADQSLIRVVDSEGDPRFHLLDTIRAYAAEQLATRGEAGEIAARHSAWFLALAQRLAPELSGEDQRRHLDELEVEHDNIRAVVDRATAAGDAPLAIGLAFAIWRFWQKRGHLSEARRRLDEMAAAPWSKADPVLRARLMEALGGVCWWQFDIRAMRPAYAEAVALWRTLGDRSELANAVYNSSFAFSVPDGPTAGAEGLDPMGEGKRALAEALGLYRELGDRRGEANVLWGIGQSKYFANAADNGVAEFLAALEGFRAVGDQTMEAWSLHMVGGALLRTGKHDVSRPHLDRALRLFHRAGDVAGITMVLDDLSSQALADEDFIRAARLWGAARALTDAAGVGIAAYTDGWIERQVRPNVRVALDPEDLQQGAREGSAMALDDAVAYALDSTVEEVRADALEPMEAPVAPGSRGH
jgi:hypothetical protein